MKVFDVDTLESLGKHIDVFDYRFSCFSTIVWQMDRIAISVLCCA